MTLLRLPDLLSVAIYGNLQDTAAKISFRVGNNNNKLSAITIVDYIPRLLNCRAKSFKLNLNGFAMTVAHSNSMEVTNAINLLMEKKAIRTNMVGVTMGWLDTPRKMSYLLEITTNNHANNMRKPITDNIDTSKHRSSVVNADPRYMADKLFCPVFYNRDKYLTLSADLSFKWNKESNHRILTISEHNYNTTAHAPGDDAGAGQLGANLEKLDAVKIRFKEFYLHLKYVTPKAQIQATLNKMLEMNGAVLQIFLNEVRVTTHPHNRSISSLSISDIFNGHIPYLYVYFANRQDYLNRDAFVPPTHHNWEGITDFLIW